MTNGKSGARVKSELEIRQTIMEMNPPLRRSGMLRAASGRYSSMLVVDKSRVTAQNPTGMVVTQGLPLEHVRCWTEFQREIRTNSGAGGVKVIVVLLLRTGDPQCVAYQRVVEVAHRTVHEQYAGAASSSGPCPYRMVQVDISDEGHSKIMNELGIKSLPLLLMYRAINGASAQLSYAGLLGGRKVKAKAEAKRPQVLLIEPNASDQIAMEKTLRLMGCDTFLCLSVSEALQRIRTMCPPSVPAPGAGVHSPSLIFDLVLVAADFSADMETVGASHQQTNDVVALSKRLDEFVKAKRTVISLMVPIAPRVANGSPRGQRTVPWTNPGGYYEGNVSSYVASCYSSLTNTMLQKPIKPMGVDHVLQQRVAGESDEMLGLTEASLLAKMQKVADDASGMISGNAAKIGIRLSAEDIKIQGRQLVAT